MKAEKGRKRKMSRKQFVLIEWTILLVIIVGLIVGGICLVRRHAGKTDRKDLQQSEKYSAASEKDDKDTCTFSFAGDCTIGSLLEWQGSLDMDFQSVVREDYAYPFSGVREIFGRDDFTVVNLEGTFTDSEDAVEKPYRFKADPVYVNVLQEGGVDAVSLANNHSGDLGAEERRTRLLRWIQPGSFIPILEIAFDRWGSNMLVERLTEMGLTVVPFGQGYKDMSAPSKELYEQLMKGNMVHGGNPVMKWMCGNVVVDTDPAGNIKPTKSRSADKIDGVVAAIMALDRCIRHEKQGSVYDERGLICF